MNVFHGEESFLIVYDLRDTKQERRRPTEWLRGVDSTKFMSCIRDLHDGRHQRYSRITIPKAETPVMSIRDSPAMTVDAVMFDEYYKPTTVLLFVPVERWRATGITYGRC